MKHMTRFSLALVTAAVLSGCGFDRSDAVDAATAIEDTTAGDDPYVVDPNMPSQHSTSTPLTMPMWDTLPEPGEDGHRYLDWEHLMPRNFDFTASLSNLDDAPVVEELDGERVRIPGYVIPLDTDLDRVYRFLLVPYVGACVHVPPPPSNQLIYAQMEEGMESAQLWEAVFVYGTLSAEKAVTEWGNTGYVLEVERWEPYTW